MRTTRMDTSIALHGTTHNTQIAATRALRSFVASLPKHTWLYPGDERFESMLDALEYHPSWGGRLDAIDRLRFEDERGGGIACVVDLVDGSRDKVGWTKTFRAVGTPRTRLSIALDHLRLSHYTPGATRSDTRLRLQIEGWLP